MTGVGVAPAPTPPRRRGSRATALLVGITRTFPVTVMLCIPFAILIFPPAITNDNPDIGFIVKVLAIAVGATGSVELTVYLLKQASPRRRRRRELEEVAAREIPRRLSRRYYIVAVGAILVGAAANNVTAMMGIGTIESQVGGSTGGGGALGSVLTLLRPYDIIGMALLIWAHRVGGCRRAAFLTWLTFAVVAKFVYVMQLGITVQFWRYLSVLMFLLLFARLVRVRTVLVVGVLVALLWPMLYAYRNEERESRGVAVSSEVDATDRLRYDLQVTRAAELTPGHDVGQIPWWQVPRYGIIPSVIDSERQPVNTGVLINSKILGGSDRSAYTFLPVATAYVLQGPVGMVVLYGLYALFVAWLIDGGRYLGGIRFITLGLFMFGPLGWFFVFPDSAISFFQAMTTALPVFVLIARRRRVTPRLAGRARHRAVGHSEQELVAIAALSPR